jgi:stress-induced morphogen
MQIEIFFAGCMAHLDYSFLCCLYMLSIRSPKNSETHFKVVVVSSHFDTVKAPLQRHRLVNAALAQELEGPVHALSIIAKAPSQWENMSKIVPASPACKGGDGSLPPKNG